MYKDWQITFERLACALDKFPPKSIYRHYDDRRLLCYNKISLITIIATTCKYESETTLCFELVFSPGKNRYIGSKRLSTHGYNYIYRQTRLAVDLWGKVSRSSSQNRTCNWFYTHAAMHATNNKLIYSYSCRGNSQAESVTSVAVLFMVEPLACSTWLQSKSLFPARAPVANTIYSLNNKPNLLQKRD